MKLTEHSDFRFKCKCCGKCCRSDLDIFLNIRDIWNLRVELCLPTYRMRGIYYEVLRRKEYGSYPICILKMNDGNCRFLDGDLCAIHKRRPSGCRMFPVMHSYDHEGNSSFELINDFEFCDGHSDEEKVLLCDWLDEIDFSDYEKCIELQTKMVFLSRANLDESEWERLTNILYDFDLLEDFPYKNEYPENRETDSIAIDWLICKAESIIESLNR